MRVDFGLFKEDELLQRGIITVTDKQITESFENLNISHRLLEGAAEIVIEVLSDGERSIKSTLNMPVHESEDWESIEMAQFTLAFKCLLNA